MSAGREFEFFGAKDGDTSGRCSVVSIYEDFAARDLLLKLCRSLTTQFKDDVDFQFDWWRFKYLADPEIAIDAAGHALDADLILLAPHSEALPKYVQGWFEDWLPHRSENGGALVLVQPAPNGAARTLPLQTYLRQTARRGRLDYLRLKTPRMVAGFEFSQLELDELVADDNRPMHWGINE
jgi:hypothetical protein